MPTFGPSVAAAAWPVLRAMGGLTSVILTTVTGSTVDYTTGQIVETTVVETVDAKVGPFRPEEVDGIRIVVADRKVLIPVNDLATPPTLLSTVTIEGVSWAQQAPPERVSNEGLWQLHVRRIGNV